MNTSSVLGPTLKSQVLKRNVNAEHINLRKLIGDDEYTKFRDSFPDSRDQLPESFSRDYANLVLNNHKFNVASKWKNKPIAIIGAGAAGLCAGYELLRSGLTPVYFESQLLSDGSARPGGRAYSWDFAPRLGLNVKSVGELGCMRFPDSHTTLHAYVDKRFRGDYKYAKKLTTQWPPFIDPLVYNHSGDIPQSDWSIVYDTMFLARGLKNRIPYRVNAGSKFRDLDTSIQDVSTAFGKLLFDENNGILTPIVQAYAKGDFDAISTLWKGLNDKYQDKSIFTVLRDSGWEQVVKGTNATSRLDFFGELGIGSGGFDAFWGTTFMEILRIKLHEDESNQRVFVGGSSYLLKPFLTHQEDGRSVLGVTNNHVITSPVIGIESESKGGVRITCENKESYLFPNAIITASPTAITSSIYIEENLISPKAWNALRRLPLTGSGKVFMAFTTPFWKGTSKVYPGRDAIVTSITDYNIRQVYAFDNYHWESASPVGVLMLSYTWGDSAHKLGSLSEKEQVESCIRMLRVIYRAEWTDDWDKHFQNALDNGNYKAISWSHERGFAGGYRMADLNRYQEQKNLWLSSSVPNSTNALFIAGEASAWLGLSGWVEGALHTGLESCLGVATWYEHLADKFQNWNNIVDPTTIKGRSFTPPADPGGIPF